MNKSYREEGGKDAMVLKFLQYHHSNSEGGFVRKKSMKHQSQCTELRTQIIFTCFNSGQFLR